MNRIFTMVIVTLFLVQPLFATYSMFNNGSNIEMFSPLSGKRRGHPIAPAYSRATTEKEDDFGGSWSDDLDDDSGIAWTNNTNITNGSAMLGGSFHTNGNLTSTVIILPDSMHWSMFSIMKDEPFSTYLNVSIINAENNRTVAGFRDLASRNIELSILNDRGISSLRLVANLSGNGSGTPRLFFWGVEWNTQNGWRDGFIGDGKCKAHSNLSFSGKAVPADLNISASLTSKVIEIPENRTWSTFHLNRTVPDDTFLNVTVHDGRTNETLISMTNRTNVSFTDLSALNALEHPSIYLNAVFQPNLTEMPVLYDWALNWCPVEAPDLLIEIGDINITEDTPTEGILNLSHYFTDPYSHVSPTSYFIHYLSDPMNITLSVNGSRLDVTHLGDNFTGNISLKIGCSNRYDLTTLSNLFNISVVNVDDAPAWTSPPPGIELDEGGACVTDWSLDHYVHDVEGDDLEWNVSASCNNITVLLNGNNGLNITALGDYFGETSINAYALSRHNHTQATANRSIPVMVKGVNDPPFVILLSPENGSTKDEVNVTFRWNASDIDDDPGSLSFDLYLAKSDPPGLYMSGLEAESITVSNLDPGATYFWFVRPSDGVAHGTCTNGTWSFKVRDVVKPRTSLISPGNDTFLNTTTARLTWGSTPPQDGTLTYFIFLGYSENLLVEVAVTNGTEYTVPDLEDNTTYYWKVVPLGASLGSCQSGVWKFTVKLDRPPIKKIDIFSDITTIEVPAGDDTTFNITLRNNGGSSMTVLFYLAGNISRYVDIIGGLEVGPGNTTVPVSVAVPQDLGPGTYGLELWYDYPDGSSRINFSVMVKEGIPVDEDDDDGMNGTAEKDKAGLTWLWISMGSIMVLFILIILIFVIRKPKREDDDIQVEGMEEEGETADNGASAGEGKEMGIAVYEKAIDEALRDGCITGDERRMLSVMKGTLDISDEDHRNIVMALAGEREVPESLLEELIYGWGAISDEWTDTAGNILPERCETDVGGTQGESNEEEKGDDDATCGPFIRSAGESFTCRICFGVVKTGLPVYTCKCGTRYHEQCIRRVGECPRCDSVPPQDMSGDAWDPVDFPDEPVDDAHEHGKADDESDYGGERAEKVTLGPPYSSKTATHPPIVISTRNVGEEEGGSESTHSKAPPRIVSEI